MGCLAGDAKPLGPTQSKLFAAAGHFKSGADQRIQQLGERHCGLNAESEHGLALARGRQVLSCDSERPECERYGDQWRVGLTIGPHA